VDLEWVHECRRQGCVLPLDRFAGQYADLAQLSATHLPRERRLRPLSGQKVAYFGSYKSEFLGVIHAGGGIALRQQVRFFPIFFVIFSKKIGKGGFDYFRRWGIADGVAKESSKTSPPGPDPGRRPAMAEARRRHPIPPGHPRLPLSPRPQYTNPLTIRLSRPKQRSDLEK
jgi:hypothetical protein